MGKLIRRTILFGFLAVILYVILLQPLASAHIQAKQQESFSYQSLSNPKPAEWSIASSSIELTSPKPESLDAGSVVPPKPELDTCLHCHLSGSDEGLWTPLARWSLFGTAGLVFAFGMYRSANGWMTRKAWKPLTYRVGEWIDSRYHISEPLSKILNKPVPAFARRWWYCLGGITAFLFVVQAVTGIMLAFYYKPTPEAAYASIQFIETEVRLGAGVRAIHHWAANGMIIMCFAHLLRVFIMGAYKPPRELNWISGVMLFLVTLLFGFTGYLLPWDQRAYWATTVCTEIAGGFPEIGNLALIFLRVGWGITDLTLSRFYGLHVFILPILTLILMGLHFLMIRQQGIAEPL